jgi:hypothetical protein
MQLLTGAPPTKVTDFTAECIQSFDISTDGRLVLGRGHINQNILQISAVK